MKIQLTTPWPVGQYLIPVSTILDTDNRVWPQHNIPLPCDEHGKPVLPANATVLEEDRPRVMKPEEPEKPEELSEPAL